ncbi:hypothetical protein [uncultured Devosia sp.]|uniref:spike base protein, RCAP_Rcc01079 family n=1 Tax=uncultured Devosia sp. TaxID=211434 RepID=UPI0035C97697
MPDRYADYASSLESPAAHAFAVTPHDTNPLPEPTRALYVGIGGSVAAVLVSGADVLFTNVADGSILPLRVTRIKATGTTATAILGLA